MTSTEMIILVNTLVDLTVRAVAAARRMKVMTPEELDALELKLRASLAAADAATPRE